MGAYTLWLDNENEKRQWSYAAMYKKLNIRRHDGELFVRKRREQNTTQIVRSRLISLLSNEFTHDYHVTLKFVVVWVRSNDFTHDDLKASESYFQTLCFANVKAILICMGSWPSEYTIETQCVLHISILSTFAKT